MKQVIVNTTTGKAFRGYLKNQDGGYLVMRDVSQLHDNGEAVPLVGDVIIERAKVDFIQALPPAKV